MNTTPRSRRERPAKPALSREWIIAETIRIVREEGLDKATMRRVAQALDTGPASLYVYVKNTAELHAAVTDQLTGTLAVSGDGSWDERIIALLEAYSEVLFAYPGLARSALTLRPMGPNTLALFDRLITLLVDGGVPAGQAAWGADLLVQLVTANAAEHAGGGSGAADAKAADRASQAAIVQAVRGADPERTPAVAAYADELLSGPPAVRFRWMLRVLLAGIATTPTAG